MVQRQVLAPVDFPCLEAVAKRLANLKRCFERRLENIVHPFEWRFTRADLNALIARTRRGWALSDHFPALRRPWPEADGSVTDSGAITLAKHSTNHLDG